MKKKPNIICITLDHLTFMHYKFMSGAKPILNAYEKLAAAGTEFLNARTAHPLCLPVRASMLTGVYTHKHGKLRNGRFDNEKEYPLVSSFLADAGYKSGYFGKNHSGFELEGQFEGYYPKGYGNPYLTKEYREYLKKENLPNPVYRQEWHVGHYPNDRYDLTVTNNFNTYTAGIMQGDERAHEACFLISLAEEWIEKNKGGKPYFLRLDFWGPHQAFTVPEKYAGILGDKEIEMYPTFNDGAENRPSFVREFAKNVRGRNPRIKTWDDFKLVLQRAYEHFTFIDAMIGKFIDGLEDRENTVITYSADHGDALGSHGGLVDKAGDLMDEVMRIPLVVSAPGYPAGVKSELFASNLDLPATVLDFAGIPVPDYMDGRSLMPVAGGDCGGWREDFMAEHYGHFDVHAVQRALYWKNYKYVATEGHVSELYDLQKDPFETGNLIDDSAFAEVRAEMERRLANNIRQFGDADAKAALL